MVLASSALPVVGIALGVLVLVAVCWFVVVRLGVRRAKIGPVEMEAGEGPSAAVLDNSISVSVQRNRFGGDVGDITGVKLSGEPKRKKKRRSR